VSWMINFLLEYAEKSIFIGFLITNFEFFFFQILHKLARFRYKQNMNVKKFQHFLYIVGYQLQCDGKM